MSLCDFLREHTWHLKWGDTGWRQMDPALGSGYLFNGVSFNDHNSVSSRQKTPAPAWHGQLQVVLASSYSFCYSVLWDSNICLWKLPSHCQGNIFVCSFGFSGVHFFFKDLRYLCLERWKRGSKTLMWDININRPPLVPASTGDWTCNPGSVCSTQEPNRRPLALLDDTQTESHQSGPCCLLN